MNLICFKVPTLPVAQPRQRHRVAFTGGKAFARNYTPGNSPVNVYKAAVQMAASKAYGGPPLEGPLVAEITCVFPSKSKKARKPKATKPDCDNLAKSTLDALNGLTYKDDGQIYKLTVLKEHANGDEQPHVQVMIRSA